MTSGNPAGGWWREKAAAVSSGWKNNFSLFTKLVKNGKDSKVAASYNVNDGGEMLPGTSEENSGPVLFIWSSRTRPRVCILGGGFAGLYTALRLESLKWDEDKKPQVLLIDQSERFVFKPLLYELISGEVDVWEIAPRFKELLANTSVQFLRDKVKALHSCDHLGSLGTLQTGCSGNVLLESGLRIEYDWLVLSLGSETKMDTVPGASEYAFPFSTLEDACKVNATLNELERKRFGKDDLIKVAIVGCGYSGVELAATLSERLQGKGLVQAINVEPTIVPNAPPGNRETALKVLTSRKVQLLLGYFVRSIQKGSSNGGNGTPEHGGPDRYILNLQRVGKGSSYETLEADIVLYTVGSRPPLPQLDRFQLPLNARGQVETCETLQVKGHPRIFALGDSSAIRDSTGHTFSPTAQVAFQQADYTGWNLWAAINDRPLLPFRYQNLGEMMTLGRSDAAVSPSFFDGVTLEGSAGHYARRLAYLMRLPTDEHRMKVGISWFAKSAVDTIASWQTTLAEIFAN